MSSQVLDGLRQTGFVEELVPRRRFDRKAQIRSEFRFLHEITEATECIFCCYYKSNIGFNICEGNDGLNDRRTVRHEKYRFLSLVPHNQNTHTV